MKILKSTLILLSVLCLSPFARATIYYIDGVTGNDSNTGVSANLAWQSLSKVNSTSFAPGDQILFKSGQEFFGKLVVSSSGSTASPIIFGKYGGDVRPVINGKNYIACIYALAKEYLEFNDLVLKNDANEDDTTPESIGGEQNAEYRRYGIYVHTGYSNSVKRNIKLNNLKVYKIYPASATNGEYKGYGIYFTSDGQQNTNYFNGLTIQNCEVTDIANVGISINKWIPNPPATQPTSQYHFNISIKNNNLHHIGGSGMVFFNVNGFIIEHNMVTYTGDYGVPDSPMYDTRKSGTGSGYWGVRNKNGILHYNEFSHVRGPGDSCGAHIDIESENIILQYNLSMDNAGGFAEYMGGVTNCIYRYNMSINDGFRVKWVSPATKISNPEMYSPNGDKNFQNGKIIWFSNYMGPNGEPRIGASKNQVYNNTIYIKPGIKSSIKFETLTNNNAINNNIFYVDGILIYLNSAGTNSANMFNGNLWIGNHSSSIPFGTSDIRNQDPLFVNIGGTEPDDYKTTSGSPAINAGLLLSNNGGQDYFGNTVSNTPDIGFFELGSTTGFRELNKNKLIVISPNPATDRLNIKVDPSLIGKTYTLYNQVGQAVLTGKIYVEKSTIELDNLEKGIYLFSINHNSNYKLKIIIQ